MGVRFSVNAARASFVSVVENGKALLFKPRDGSAGTVGHDDIQDDPVVGWFGWRCRFDLDLRDG